MTTTTVYRIEQPNHHGICHSHGLCGAYHHVAGGQCPANSFGAHGWDAELACMGISGWHYAFVSLDKLHEWFPSEAGRKAMADRGGRIVPYTVDGPQYNVIPDLPGMQCIFNPAAATAQQPLPLV